MRKCEATHPSLAPADPDAHSTPSASDEHGSAWRSPVNTDDRPDLAALRVLVVLHREAIATQRARLNEQSSLFHDIALLLQQDEDQE